MKFIFRSGKFQSEAFLQYKDETGAHMDDDYKTDNDPSNNENNRNIESNGYNQYNHPVFPGGGQLILGQEQEIPCGGFDDTDSLSADVSRFEVILKLIKFDHMLNLKLRIYFCIFYFLLLYQCFRCGIVYYQRRI